MMMVNTAEKKEPPSSSSPPIPKKDNTEKEKSIYIRAEDHAQHECIRWYVIHASGPAATTALENIPASTCVTKLRSISVMPSIISSRSACVACDSTIYAFNGGGYTKYGPEVLYLDTRNPSEGWKIGPSMRVARTQKRAAVVGGEIYVMGYKCRGDDKDNVDQPLWEVLDPLMNEWTTLVPPHPDLVSSRIIWHAVHGEGKKVLIYPEGRDGRNTALYMYDVDAKSWEIIDKDFGASLYQSRRNDELTPCIVVDDILYFYERSIGVKAYDLVRHKWFLEPVRGLNNYKDLLCPSEKRYDTDDPVKVFLAHVGNGKLCLLWENFRMEEDDKGKFKWRGYVRCTKFRVIRQSDGMEEVILHALIDSFFVYSFADSDDERILDCLAL